ncbi:hypothetical protein SVIO_067470 [Streptomyces violaceusniger]|uniref:Uncharacterized protein n=1 Tax=Streptomyces violaceusniger TaxID=68280 RepID=A0A4D4L6S5_STRVO|nr:hypothetical protein SVIO_067470 [Streptomyces violaceusniger]
MPLFTSWPWDDQLAFVFDGGTLSPGQISGLHPHDHELSACAFLPSDGALAMLPPRTRRRATHALRALAEQHPAYLENGERSVPYNVDCR